MPDRSPEEINDLRAENRRQNNRLKDIEDDIAVMKADINGLWRSQTKVETGLFGPTGQNGMRGTMIEFHKSTAKRLDGVDASMTAITESLSGVSTQLHGLMTTLRTIVRIAAFVVGVATIAGIAVGIWDVLSVG